MIAAGSSPRSSVARSSSGACSPLQNVAEQAEVRESLRRLEGYQIQDVRDQEMLESISERIVAPALAALAGFTPPVHAAGLPRGDRAQARARREPERATTVDQLLV